MSYPTKPAFIFTGGWGEETRAHPAMKWMEEYTKELDARNWSKPASQDHTPDFTLVKSTGQVVSGADAAWKAIGEEVYAPFSAQLHDPEFVVCWEESDGYSMFGIAKVYGNLAKPGDEPKVKGRDGKEWDVALPGAFRFRYVKDGEGLKLARSEIFSDPSAAIVTMLKRGMITGEQLMHM